MRILLAGASGFLGGHLLRALAGRGHQVTCLVRGRAKQAIDAMRLAGVHTLEGNFTRPADWLAHVAGHDAVVNAVGIIRETAGASFDAVHRDAPLALFRAAKESGAKVIQISAMGADARAASRYHLNEHARAGARACSFFILATQRPRYSVLMLAKR